MGGEFSTFSMQMAALVHFAGDLKVDDGVSTWRVKIIAGYNMDGRIGV